MRHLVVSCDGTWSTPEQSHAGVPTPTNVVRLHHALTDSEVQLRYYHPGVGTGPGLVDRLRGGGMGAGLSANIKSAYAWLAGTHRPGDAICLFGFSRGAYTVRSLAGMLAACGLVRFAEGTGPAQRWAEIDRLYDEVYRPARRRARAVPHPPVTVDFLGVWDTVGALGIPDSFGVLNLVDDDERHRFHDTRLGAHVTHARHALALDETRGPFTPTAWTGPVPDGERTVRQVWFPGGHGDVGGGHPQPGLSDGALQWMIDEASVCTGLRFRKEVLEQIRPDPSDVLHDECTGFFRHLSPAPRAIPMIDESSAEVVHSSAFARRARPPITVGSYRPTRVLAVGEQARCPVYAGDPWNGTGLYLTPGRYRFRAEGEWLDRGLAVGPGGTRDGRFHPSEVFQLVGDIAGWWQERFRELSGNDAATFLGAPRVDAPWMALVGVVAAVDVDADGAQRAYSPFVVGRGVDREVDRPGYLYAFANDAWGFYDNNRGSVQLTVTRPDG